MELPEIVKKWFDIGYVTVIKKTIGNNKKCHYVKIKKNKA